MPASVTPAQLFWRDDALPFAESRRAQSVVACYTPHTHTRYSVGTVDQGCTLFSWHGHSQRLYRGDTVLIPACEVHACNPDSGEAWAYQMLYLDEDWLAGLVGEISQQDAVTLPCTMAGHQPQVYAALCRLNACLFGDTERAEQEVALVRFAGEVFGSRRAIDTGAKRMRPDRLAAVQELILARCTEPLPLALLAETAGLSRYHFVRTFQRSVGMTPHAWQLDARINHARALLQQGMPLAQVAQDLGFADQSHFQRAFKQRVAVTPRQYQRNIVQEIHA